MILVVVHLIVVFFMRGAVLFRCYLDFTFPVVDCCVHHRRHVIHCDAEFHHLQGLATESGADMVVTSALYIYASLRRYLALNSPFEHSCMSGGVELSHSCMLYFSCCRPGW